MIIKCIASLAAWCSPALTALTGHRPPLARTHELTTVRASRFIENSLPTWYLSVAGSRLGQLPHVTCAPRGIFVLPHARTVPSVVLVIQLYFYQTEPHKSSVSVLISMRIESVTTDVPAEACSHHADFGTLCVCRRYDTLFSLSPCELIVSMSCGLVRPNIPGAEIILLKA
jgi:hypothetical protein